MQMMRDLTDDRITKPLAQGQHLLKRYLCLLKMCHAYQQARSNPQCPMLYAEVDELAVKTVDLRKPCHGHVAGCQAVLEQTRPSVSLTERDMEHGNAAYIFAGLAHCDRFMNAGHIVICRATGRLQDSALCKQQQLVQAGVNILRQVDGLVNNLLNFFRALTLAPAQVNDSTPC